jgi:hypothetical protein
MPLETSFQVAPFKKDSLYTKDKLTFMIDSDAKQGDMPDYKGKKERAFLCGFASHCPPDNKGSEVIKPIFRDDFCLWGHITEGGQRYKLLPMYFIPHGSGIEGLTNVPNAKYKFNRGQTQRRVFSNLMADPVPELQPSGLVESDGPQDPPAVQGTATAGKATTNGADDSVTFDTAEQAPTAEEVEALRKEQEAFEQPLQEADFGPEVAAADQEADAKGNDW